MTEQDQKGLQVMDFDGDSQAFEGFSARPRYGLVLTNGVTVREFNSYYGLTEQEAVSWPD